MVTSICADEERGTYPLWRNLHPRNFHVHNLSYNVLMKIRPNVVNSSEVSLEAILQLGHVIACDDVAKWFLFSYVENKTARDQDMEDEMR